MQIQVFSLEVSVKGLGFWVLGFGERSSCWNFFTTLALLFFHIIEPQKRDIKEQPMNSPRRTRCSPPFERTVVYKGSFSASMPDFRMALVDAEVATSVSSAFGAVPVDPEDPCTRVRRGSVTASPARSIFALVPQWPDQHGSVGLLPTL